MRSQGTLWGEGDYKSGGIAWHDVNGSDLCESESRSVVSDSLQPHGL